MRLLKIEQDGTDLLGKVVKKGAGFWYVNINGRTVASYPEDLEVVDE